MVPYILHESKLLLLSDLPLLLFFTLLLIFPVSAICLSQVLMNNHITDLIHNLLLRLSLLQRSGAAGDSRVNDALLEHVARALAAEVMAAPVALTLMTAAKVGVWTVVRRRREGREGEIRLEEAVEEGVGMWLRMGTTYVWGAAMMAAAAAMWVNVVAAGSYLAGARLLTDAMAATLFVGLLPLVVVALRFGIVAAGLHPAGLWGPSAIAVSFSMLLNHSCHLFPALFLFVIPSSASAAAELAFHTLVVRRPSAEALALAPLIISFHALVQLFDAILCYSFFMACYEEGEAHALLEPEEEEDDEDGAVALNIEGKHWA